MSDTDPTTVIANRGTPTMRLAALVRKYRELQRENERLRSALVRAADELDNAATQHKCMHCASKAEDARWAAKMKEDTSATPQD